MRSIFTAILVSLCVANLSPAQDPNLPSQDAGLPTDTDRPVDGNASSQEIAEKTDRQIQDWIEKLESPRFRDRVEASSRLGRSGLPAIESLRRVVTEGSVEASDRAFDILKRHHSSDDAIVQAAATEALEQIAQQKDHPKSEAAEMLLRSPDAETDTAQQPRNRLLPVRPLPAAANRRVQVQIKFAGGTKDITVNENGKKIRLIENADGSIEVHRDNGKGGKDKSKFKNRDELKEKDAEAFKALERVPKLPKLQLPEFRPAAPRLPPLPQFRPSAKPGDNLPPDVRKRHEEILKRHEQLRLRLEQRSKELHERLQRPLPPALPPKPKPAEKKPDQTIKV